MLRSAQFHLDVWPDATFNGFTADATWNGFACPLFRKSEALRIMEKQQTVTDGTRLTYDADADAFLLHDPHYPTDPPVAFDAVQIDGYTVYPIGSYYWTWSEV